MHSDEGRKDGRVLGRVDLRRAWTGRHNWDSELWVQGHPAVNRLRRAANGGRRATCAGSSESPRVGRKVAGRLYAKLARVLTALDRTWGCSDLILCTVQRQLSHPNRTLPCLFLCAECID